MNRRHFLFECEGARLAATLDDAPGTVALLLVSGGNEVRAGAWNGQAKFAARIAGRGYPVMRFDRRGVGDSEGVNGEFRSSAPDIAAALAALRRECPQVIKIVAFGNCDAASALMLTRGAGIDAMVLSNPWTIDNDARDEPAEVVRDHYRRRLTDPAAIRRLLTGKVSIGKLLRSLLSAARPASAGLSGLAAEMAEGIATYRGCIRFLVAARDRTGQAFLAKWNKSDTRIRICPDATHSYVELHAQDWLVEQVIAVLEAQ
ncbi:hydrolase 1, exosortase A system-associated [Novosphingobium mathurense]|uniref:Exosortase A system-associated hydrolase 1 n=1 Tax=Novosphingobium mathurense TaxID=428990 RepID=A0A1U6GVK4_9SPHN|nr:hydrolase 1, exosortase A system-associated [Novosphingobium mathurense]SLJ87536.1 exosortase A system-associated hydrolase 1 [Novosphingobium mathurense]